MDRIEILNLGEHYFQETLENGLTIRVIPKPDFAKTHAFFATNYGSLDTKFQQDGQWNTTPAGVAHYLEHKMFDMPEGNVMQWFSKVGGSPNAFTSHAITAYYVQCTDRVAENLEILLKYVTTPYFTKESVDKEQGIIAQEIRMYEDSPGSRLYENLLSTMYPGHAMGVSIAGTVESISEITAQTLYDCHRAFYDPSNMVLTVAGPVEPEMVVELAEKIVPASNGIISDRDYGTVPPISQEMLQVEQAMEVAMPTFALAFRCPTAKEQRLKMELLGDLAAEMLAGESTPLYTRMYEDGIIDCDFSGGYETIKDVSFLTFSGDSNHPDQVVEALLAEAKRIGQEGVDPQLFARLKKSAFGRKIRELDSFENICYRMSEDYFCKLDYFSFPEIYQEITVADAQRFLQDYVQVAGSALSIIKPKEVQ